MAGRDLTYKIGVDSSQGVAGVKQFSSAVKKELKSIEGDFDDTATAGEKVATVLSQLAKGLDDELGRAAQAADALATALGPELAGKADVGQLVGDLQRMGLTFEEITTDADKLAAALKEMDAVQMKGLDSGLGGVNTKIGDLGRSADSSRSVMANMIGNVSQDLGGLIGISGSTGVAIGQMGEYMADAAGSGEKFSSVLGNFATVAGPILAIATAMQTVTAAIAEGKAHQEALTEETKRLGEAMQESGDLAANFAEEIATGSTELNENVQVLKDHGDVWELTANTVAKNIPLIGQAFKALIDDGVDVNKALEDIGLSAGDLGLAVAGTWEDWRRFKDGLDAARESGALSEREYDAITKRVGELSSALETNRLAQQAMVPLLTRQLIAEQRLSVEEAARADNLAAYNEAQQEAVDAQQQLTDGTKALAEAQQSVDYKTADLTGAVTAMGKFNEEQFALTNMAQTTQEAYDALGDSLVQATEEGERRLRLTADVTTEAGRKQQDAIEGIASALEVQFAGAFDKADGNARKFQRSAREIGETTLSALQEQLGLSADDVALLRDELGLTAKDYRARFEMSGTEEAITQLGLLQGAIDTLPEDVQIQVQQQILAGDYQGALQTVQTYYDEHPISATVVYDEHRLPRVGDIVYRANGGDIERDSLVRVGERGSELVALPGGSHVYPHGVTPTSAMGGMTTLITQNFVLNAAAVGDPYAVAQAMEEGGRRAARLMPRNP